MKLKTNETTYTEELEIETAYPNPNDALFGQQGLDTPYQITNNNVKSKKIGPDTKKIILIVVAVVIFIGLTILKYNSRHKLDGNYELIGVTNYGVYYTVEELEENSGMDIYAKLEVNGTNCHMEFDYTYTKESFDAFFKIRGNDISVSSGGETMNGEYDAEDETITFTEGVATLVFEKVN